MQADGIKTNIIHYKGQRKLVLPRRLVISSVSQQEKSFLLIQMHNQVIGPSSMCVSL